MKCKLLLTLISFYCFNVKAQSLKYGIFVHYLNSLQNTQLPWSQGNKTSWDSCVNSFNVKLFAAEVNETGADYVIFTVNQIDRYFCIPLKIYEKKTGYKRGEATSHRDLISELYKELKTYNIKLFIYLTGDGPRGDIQASIALANPSVKKNGNSSFQVDQEWLNNWTQILKAISKKYRKKVTGYWIDGCYEFIGYDADFLNQLSTALKAGNANTMFALNNGPKDFISEYYSGTYTAGESDFFKPQTIRNFRIKPHILSYLGSYWAKPGLRYTAEYMSEYIQTMNKSNGMVTIDVCVLRDGSIDSSQLQQLKKIRKFINQ